MDKSHQPTLQMIEKDMAFVLHSHAERLSAISELLEPVREYLVDRGTDIPHTLDVEQWEDLAISLISSIAQRVDRVVSDCQSNIGERVDPPLTVRQVLSNREKLHEFSNPSNRRRVRLPFLLELAKETACIYIPSSSFKAKREEKREITALVTEARRLIAYWYMLRADESILELREQTKTIQSIYRGLAAPVIPFSRISAKNILRLAIKDQQAYADQRQIRIQVSSDTLGTAGVLGDVSQLVRCLSNLINNAIKYSYKFAQDIWVDIRATCDHGHVCFRVENWGTPIHQSEIQSGALLKFGVRGSSPSEEGKIGTGIGLTDSNLILQRHGGTLEISSAPTQSGRTSPTRPLIPYITVIQMRVPRVDG